MTKKQQRTGQKILSIFSSFVLLFNTFLPTVSYLASTTPAYAEEVATEETVVAQEATEPEVVVEEEQSVEASQTEASDTQSDTPTSEAENPQESQESTDEETAPVLVTEAPQATASGDEVDETSEEIVEEETSGELLALKVDSSTSTPIDLSSEESNSSATLSTDKEDYAPTEEVLISGSGFEVNTEYLIVISSEDEPAVSHEAAVTSDEDGYLTYKYQLDGTYRPNYLAEIFLGGVLVASTTFTDGPVGNSLKSHEVWQPLNNTWVPGQPKGYTEGESAAFRVKIETGNSVSNPLTFDICLEYYNSVKDAYAFTELTAWDVDYSPTLPAGFSVTDSTGPAVYASNAIINSVTPNGVGGGICSGSYLSWTVEFTQVENTTAYILYGGRIAAPGDSLVGGGTVESGKSASYINGVFQARVNTTGSGDKTVNFKSSDIIPLGNSLTIIKEASLHSSQEFLFTTTGEGLSNFSLVDDAEDSTTNSKIFTPLASGSYSVTELDVSGWSLDSISCLDGDSSVGTVDGSTVNLQLTDGQNIVCTFSNTRDTGSVTVKKNVDENGDGDWDDEGETNVANWTWNIEGGDQAISMGGTRTLVTGDYVITETQKNDYSLIYWTCDDDSTGTTNAIPVTLEADDNLTCEFFNFHLLPEISTFKLRESSETAYVGDTDITFTIEASNSGNTTLYNPVIIDMYDSDYLEFISSTITPPGEIIVPSISDPILDVDDYDGDGNKLEHYRVLTWQLADLAPGESYLLTLTFKALQITTPDSDPDTRFTGNLAYSTACLDESCNNEITSQTSVAKVDIDALGSVSGQKFVDLDGDGLWNGADSPLNGVTVNLTDLDKESTVSAQTAGEGEFSFGDLATGEYLLCEIVPAGYAQTYPAADGCHQFSISDDGEARGPYNFGNQGRATVIVEKQVEPVEFDQDFDFSISGTHLDADIEFSLGDDDSEEFEVPAGSYVLGETENEDFTTVFQCNDDQEATVGTSTEFDLEAGGVYSCVFTNTIKRGGIEVFKFNDEDEDGQWNEGEEELLSGWTMVLDGDVDGAQVTDEFGKATFSNLLPGTYDLNEVQKENWNLTNIYCTNEREQEGPRLLSLLDLALNNEGYLVTVTAGATTSCYVGNHGRPILEIEKTNDKPDVALNVGDIVTYTITVTNTGVGRAKDVTVTDVLPNTEMFKLLLGTGEVNNDGTISNQDPTGTNPYIWEVGTLEAGKSLTISYQVEVLSTAIPGAHTNIAFVEGTGSDTISAGPAKSVVHIGQVVDYSANSPIQEIGEVLGASTGADTLWLILASGLIATGAVMNLLERKKYA
jgi:uncharacterized repeat protein (TIGR01451 family)